jgi:arabinofuranan 3-O-arabinosyltransferase
LSTTGLSSAGGGAPWIASAADASPVLHLTWQGIRTIGELVLGPAPGAAFPTSVEVASPQGTRLASVGKGGVVRLARPLRTNELYVIFPGTQSAALGVGGGPGQLPVGLSKLTIPGLAGLRVAAPSDQATFRLACGQGPTVSVDGKQFPTEVSGSVADLVQTRPVEVRLCAPGGRLTLNAGRHWLLATPSGAFVVTDLDLRTQPGAAPTSSGGTVSAGGPGASPGAASATSTAAAGSAGQRTIALLTWQADRRSLRIGAGAESYLEVHENFNAGWSATLNGRPLTAVRLDGWQQAFIVPAGQGGVIKLSYLPATVYHAGLIASALALVALAVLATGLGRQSNRRRDEPRTSPRARRAARTGAVFVPLAVVIGLAGGPVVLAVPVLACLGWWRPRWLPPVALGAMLIAGVAAASASSLTAVGSGAFGGLAQACALVALTAALMPGTAREASRPGAVPAAGEERAT